MWIDFRRIALCDHNIKRKEIEMKPNRKIRDLIFLRKEK